ncbi:MAG: hypothetical protein M3R36_18270 [Bacteroidota bacterium]|nr:hypothetical protein [Bacteroidota bacterium]
MIKRNLFHPVIASLKDSPVILINGARQSGKTTIVKYLVKEKIISEYITLMKHLT